MSLHVGVTEQLTVRRSGCWCHRRTRTATLLMLVSGKASQMVSLDVGTMEGLTLRLSLMSVGTSRKNKQNCKDEN